MSDNFQAARAVVRSTWGKPSIPGAVLVFLLGKNLFRFSTVRVCSKDIKPPCDCATVPGMPVNGTVDQNMVSFAANKLPLPNVFA